METSDKPTGTESTGVNRRGYLKVVGAGSTLFASSLAGCSGSSDSGDGGDGGDGGGDSDGGSTSTSTGTSGGGVDEVVIGSNHPLTGPLAFAGQRMNNAIKFAAQKKNEAGGIESLGGATVNVISGDHQGKQELGSQVTQELIDDGADIITGCYVSPVTLAATRTAEQEQVPFVISVAVDPSIMDEREMNWTYRNHPGSPGFAVQYADMVPKLARENGVSYDTAALYIVDNSYGQSVERALMEELPKHDVEIVEAVRNSVAASSASTQVTRIRQADPDAIVHVNYVSGGVTLARAMQDQDYRPPLMTACVTGTWVNQDAILDVGEFANGIIDNNYYFDQTNPDAAAIPVEFRNEYDQDMGSNVAMAYTAAQVMIEAIEQAGSANNDDINQALKEIEFSDHIMAMPPITYNDEGKNENALAPALQVQGLETQVVYPQEYANSEIQL